MPTINSEGTLWSGVGAAQGWLWRLNDAQPVSVGAGAAGGWFQARSFFGSSPRGAVWSPSLGNPSNPWPQSLGMDEFPANVTVAGGDYIGASNGQTSIGDVPPGYESWQWHAISPDGIRVMVLNGEYRAWYPGHDDSQNVSAATVSVGAGCVINVNGEGTLGQVVSNGAYIVPAQRPGLKYFATSFLASDGASWLMYSSAELGKFICHRGNDASQGYILDDLTMLGPVGPCGVTLADGRSVAAWASAPGQQGPDLRRWIGVLGVNMVPFVVVPEPPQPEPEPEPMPPTDPIKPGKTKAAYLNALAAAVSHRTGMPAQGSGGAWQGINEAWDQLMAAKDWMNGNALARGAFCRSGSDAIHIPQTVLDVLTPDCVKIDQEFLQGR